MLRPLGAPYRRVRAYFDRWLFQLHGARSGPIELVQRRIFILPSRYGIMYIVALLVMPYIWFATLKFQRDSNRAYLAVRERVGANLSALQESIAAVRVIQAYSREEEQIRRFRASNRALYRSHMKSVKVSTWYFGLIEFSGVLASALIVGIGGWLVHRGSVSVGTVVAFVLLLTNLFDPVQHHGAGIEAVSQENGK